MVQRRNRHAEDEWEESEKEDYTPITVPLEYRELQWEEERITVRELWDRYLDGVIVLQPDFQRNYVWDPTKASRYVESLLLRLPTPPIFLAEENDGSLTVIDGHQRLETLFRYLQPLLSGPAKLAGREHHRYTVVSPLSLRNLEVMSELNGKNVTALMQDDRGRFWDTRLSVIRLPRTAHPDMKYALFARLNQGSMSLNSQELRNCLYRGAYNNLIAQLGEAHVFLRLWNKNLPDKRMRHRELVLRFFALLHRRDRYRTPFSVFLNDEMDEHRNLTVEDQRQFRHQLEIAMKWVERVFGTEVFRIFRAGNEANPSGRWIQRRYDLLYEVGMVGFGQFGAALDRVWETINPLEQDLIRSSLRHKLVDVMTNSQFVDAISEGTTRPSNLNLRFNLWNQALNSVVQDASTAIQQEGESNQQRLRQANTCSVCPNQLTPDDAVWLHDDRGRQLVHRFCRSVRQ